MKFIELRWLVENRFPLVNSLYFTIEIAEIFFNGFQLVCATSKKRAERERKLKFPLLRIL